MRTFNAVVLEYPHMANSRILWLTASPAADRQQWAHSRRSNWAAMSPLAAKVLCGPVSEATPICSYGITE